MDNKKRIWAIFAAVVVVVILSLAALIYFLFVNPAATATLRDIAIIMLALESVIVTLLLMGTLFFLWWIILILKDEIIPILESTGETVNRVRGTTAFVSDTVVSPLIKASSYVAGVRRALKVLTGLRSRKQ